jgi:ligand-binding sensor domain-containing protein
MKPRTLSSFLLLSLAWSVLAVSVHAEHLPLRLYTSADGLGSSFIDYILRDSRGFMWFATRDGLSRFDGSHFVTYRVGEKNSPPGVEGIFETRGGNYWVSTSAGMFRFNAKTLSRPVMAVPRAFCIHRQTETKSDPW